MTDVQKKILLVLTIVIGLTRFAAVAKSLWDWDEALFALAVSDYDVTQHRPHPPGYPLFVAAAKAVHLAGVPEFRALQVIALLGAIAVFPAAFLLAKELGFGFATSIAGAAIFAFLPNVWLYGGTGFSDIPAIALAFAGSAFLLRGRRESRAYILGAVLLALAAAIRPTNLLVGLVPGMLATWDLLRARSWRPVLLAALLGAVIVAGSYAGAALASESVANYRKAVRVQAEWVRDVDSWQAKIRPPLKQLAPLFFLTPVQHEDLMWPLAGLAALSAVVAIVRRRAAPLLTLAIFGPIAVISWLQLDFTAASRYSIAYLALHAFLAADGLGILAVRRDAIHAVLAGVVVIVFGAWTWPALTVQRTTDAPPVQALKWVLANAPAGVPIIVHGGLGPHTDIYLANRAHSWFDKPEELATAPGNAYVVQPHGVPRAFNFERPKGRLWKTVRQRHFEASVLPLANMVAFDSGWYGEEGTGGETFRWMAKEGRLLLPPLPGMGTLSMRFHVPEDLVEAPSIDVVFNGQTVETIVGRKGAVERRWTLLSRRWQPNELRIVTSATANPKRMHGIDDDRELGLLMKGVTWFPAKP